MIEAPIQKKHFLIMSEDYKIFFFNIKKVASSSIKKYILENLNGRVFLPEESSSELWYKNYQEYFSFAFVRNPFDRLLSCYNNKIKNPNVINKKTGIDVVFDKYDWGNKFYKDMSFKKFLEAIVSLDPDCYDDHFCPQYKYVCDQDENLVVDFIGKFETIERDFNYLISKKNLPILRLPHINESTYKEVYNKETTELAKQVYGLKKDLEIFNYEY